MADERRHATNPFDNPEFRDEFNRTLTLSLQPFVEITARHEAELKAQAATLSEQRGSIKVIAALWTVFTGSLITGLEYLFHKHS